MGRRVGAPKQLKSGRQPDPWWMRYANVVLVLVVLAWVSAMYVWRLCYPMIVEKPSALGSRTRGIGLLVGFAVLWLMSA